MAERFAATVGPVSVWSVSLKVTLTRGRKMPRKGMPATALPDGGGVFHSSSVKMDGSTR